MVWLVAAGPWFLLLGAIPHHCLMLMKSNWQLLGKTSLRNWGALSPKVIYVGKFQLMNKSSWSLSQMTWQNASKVQFMFRWVKCFTRVSWKFHWLIIECDLMRFIFQCSSSCGSYTSSISVAVIAFHWLKKSSTAEMTLLNELFSPPL